MKELAIVIPTYRRVDNTTPYYLTKALTSIKDQTYQNYKVFLIGDHYDDNDEFFKLATSIIDLDK
jgi:glycosyltransferase involved in cell wall biosynthesis